MKTFHRERENDDTKLNMYIACTAKNVGSIVQFCAPNIYPYTYECLYIPKLKKKKNSFKETRHFHTFSGVYKEFSSEKKNVHIILFRT